MGSECGCATFVQSPASAPGAVQQIARYREGAPGKCGERVGTLFVAMGVLQKQASASCAICRACTLFPFVLNGAVIMNGRCLICLHFCHSFC